MRPPASTTATVWAAARSRLQRRASSRSGWATGSIVPRSGQVPTTTSAPTSRSDAHRLGQVAHRHGLVDPVRHVVGADHDDGHVGLGDLGQGVGELDVEARGLRPDHRDVGQPHPPAAQGGDAVGDDRADRLPATCRRPSRRRSCRRGRPARWARRTPAPYRALSSGAPSNGRPTIRRAIWASILSRPYPASPSTPRPAARPPPPYAAVAAIRVARRALPIAGTPPSRQPAPPIGCRYPR